MKEASKTALRDVTLLWLDWSFLRLSKISWLEITNPKEMG